MAKNIIIIEAPGKVAKFKKCVGKGWEVYPTVGHCVDLPVKKLGVDIKKNFEPTWEVKGDSIETVKTIQKACKNADNIYLMTDEDREGEAIAWHIYEKIKDCKGKIHRATTNQITDAGIQQALDNPGDLNYQKIKAYLARRLLDRLCGYKTSFLTQQATGGRSAGRVQSAVLRVIVDRELEILAFVPEEYWVLTADLLTQKGDRYSAVLDEKIKVSNVTEATKIYDACIKSTPKIASVESKEVDVKPYAPFTTLPMVSSAASVFGWPAEKVMNVAQGLYTGGHITYHRTDSPFMAPEAVTEIRNYVQHTYGNNYTPSHPFIYTAKAGAQEAHECCRPTSITETPSGLDADQKKLYGMIWKRAVASQMAPARDRRIKVVTDIAGYDFISNGKIELFDGFRKCWDYGSSEDVILPDLKQGETVSLKSLEKEQKFTSPPPRYTDSSLAKLCEKKQITRPATVANVFKTLKDRDYVTKKKNTFHPTETGIAVVNFLKKSDMCFVDVEFTVKMEELLDQIQSGDKTENDVLTQFWDRLKQDIENGKKVKSDNQKSEHVCPKCGGSLLKKHSKFGAFYSCEHWKKAKEDDEESGGCDYTAKVGEHGEPVEKVVKVKEYADFVCKKCKGKMIKRSSKYGDFYGCEKFPKCKTTADMEGVFKESTGKKWKKGSWKSKKKED